MAKFKKLGKKAHQAIKKAEHQVQHAVGIHHSHSESSGATSVIISSSNATQVVSSTPAIPIELGFSSLSSSTYKDVFQQINDNVPVQILGEEDDKSLGG